jgi:hypothetical protein
VKAVEAADGAIAEESQVKPRELPPLAVARAKELGSSSTTRAPGR